jgi:hypothetical protein
MDEKELEQKLRVILNTEDNYTCSYTGTPVFYAEICIPKIIELFEQQQQATAESYVKKIAVKFCKFFLNNNKVEYLLETIMEKVNDDFDRWWRLKR